MAMVSRCCINQCGILLPLLVNGAYRGDGRTIVEFNVATSLTCGIPVIDVLQGNLQGLMGRDDIIELNPNADSMRLKMELPGYERFIRKMNTPANNFTIEKLVRGVCRQIGAFIAEAQVSADANPEELMLGQGGIGVEQLVLVSIKRVTIGCWVPCIRIVENQIA